MYNVGDKVIIKSHPYKYCQQNQTHRNRNLMFTDSMRNVTGQMFTIIVRQKNNSDWCYKINDPINSSNWFLECALQPYKTEPKKEILKKSVPEKSFIIKPRKSVAKIPYKQFRLGIELETIAPNENEETIVDAIHKESLPFIWETDGSIDYDEEKEQDLEFKGSKPFTYTELKSHTRKLLSILNDNEVFVNTSSGFHLHVSNKRFFNEKVMNRIIYTWSAIEDFLLATQPRSRLNNSYCKRYLLEYVQHEKDGRKLLKGKANLINQLQGERYRTLNLTALAKHGTIEIRLHAGTTQYKKVIAWVDLMLAFFTYCLKDYNHREVTNMFYQKISEQKIDNVCNMLGLSEKDSLYFKGRIHKMLFDMLVKQQESAGKIIKNIKTIQKAKERADKAQAHYRDVDRAYQQEFETLNFIASE